MEEWEYLQSSPLMGAASLLELAGLALLVSLVNVLLGASEPTLGPIKSAYEFLQHFELTKVAVFIVIFVVLKNVVLMVLNYLTARIAYDSMSAVFGAPLQALSASAVYTILTAQYRWIS